MLRCKCVRRPRKRVEDISAASDVRGSKGEKGDAWMVRASAKLKPHRRWWWRARMRCYTPWRGEKRTLVHDRWPRLDRSIIQGFALDDVDGLPGRSYFVLKAPRRFNALTVEVIIPEASFFDLSHSRWIAAVRDPTPHSRDLKTPSRNIITCYQQTNRSTNLLY